MEGFFFIGDNVFCNIQYYFIEMVDLVIGIIKGIEVLPVVTFDSNAQENCVASVIMPNKTLVWGWGGGILS